MLQGSAQGSAVCPVARALAKATDDQFDHPGAAPSAASRLNLQIQLLKLTKLWSKDVKGQCDVMGSSS